LEKLTRASSTPVGLARRARLVLLAADGISNTEIEQRLEVSRPTVLRWRNRYQSKGIAGLVDEAIRTSTLPILLPHKALLRQTRRTSPLTTAPSTDSG
jgi:transposase